MGGLVGNIDFFYTMSLYDVNENDWNEDPKLFDSVFTRALITTMGTGSTMSYDNVNNVIALADDLSVVVSSRIQGLAPGSSNKELKQKITNAVESGSFAELLQRYAREQGCDGLANATAAKLDNDDDANAGKSDSGTSSNGSSEKEDSGAISGIVLGLTFFVCCIRGLYLYIESAENEQYKEDGNEIAMIEGKDKC